jgi:hypothetical protein
VYVCVCAVLLLYPATPSRIYSKSLISPPKSFRAFTFYVRTKNVNSKCVCHCIQQLHVEVTGSGDGQMESAHLTNRTLEGGGGI